MYEPEIIAPTQFWKSMIQPYHLLSLIKYKTILLRYYSNRQPAFLVREGI